MSAAGKPTLFFEVGKHYISAGRRYEVVGATAYMVTFRSDDGTEKTIDAYAPSDFDTFRRATAPGDVETPT
jgi:hypothetical protein